MGVVEQSSATVESCLSMLEESYGSFSINQTTLSVPEAEYEQAITEARKDRIDVYAKVQNDDAEVLHVRDQNTPTLPSTTTSSDGSLEREAKTAVQQRTGIECSITAVEQATILGITNDDDADSDTIYRLAVLFEARYDAGAVNENGVWQQSANPPQPIKV
jgi:ADP-ribose pyrophosphatase YjhB (NUDIX family)